MAADRGPPAAAEMSRNLECLKLRIKCSPAHWTIPGQAEPTKEKGNTYHAKVQ